MRMVPPCPCQASKGRVHTTANDRHGHHSADLFDTLLFTTNYQGEVG
jgi:hypothetical protein